VTTGDWIRYAREEVGLTQQDVAVAAGCCLRTVARIEAGENMRVGTLMAIARVLDTPIGDLVVERSARNAS